MEKLLVKYDEDFGRMGRLEGLFICTKDELELLNGRLINYGEVLGKNSEVYTDEVYKNCEVISEDPDLISDLQTVSKYPNTICGYSPFDYIEEEYEDEGLDDE